MSITTDPNDPALKTIRPDGQQEAYLVMSEEERSKGWVRPYRDHYEHVGRKPLYELRDLTEEEQARYGVCNYIKYEKYPEESPIVGRFWTAADLLPGCGTVTHMPRSISETYAKNPHYYGSTFCCGCGVHLPVAQFVWSKDRTVVGS